MKFVVQRVKNAQVDIEEKTVGKIDKGFMVLIGVTHTDTKEVADYLVKKLINLRIFNDDYYIQQAPELSYMLSQTS